MSDRDKCNSDVLKSLSEFIVNLKSIEAESVLNGRRTGLVAAIIEKLNNLELHSELSELKNSIIEIYKNEKNWQNDTEETFKSSFELDLENTDCIFFI